MEKNLQNLFLALVVGGMLALSSCSEDEPLPASSADFVVASFAPEVAVPVKFDNLSLNASYYVWDYGDGTTDSASNISPSHVYEAPGEYTVTLRAYNGDNAFTESSLDVSVGQRYVTSTWIYALSMEDSLGDPWDEDSGPDVLWTMGPSDGTTAEEFIQIFEENVNGEQDDAFTIPDGYSFEGFDYILEDKNYVVVLEEVDTVESEPEYVFMAGYEFNPVVQSGNSIVTSSKFENGTGIIQVPFVDFEGFQVLIRFEIR